MARQKKLTEEERREKAEQLARAREALRWSAEILGAHDRMRQPLQDERDVRIMRAQDAGATWGQLREDTGMSTQGLSLALKRARSTRWNPVDG